ncbi:response regulator transcription factor [Agromyces mariniharenae]|uniref:Response regulator transcription factor n=1 Tax=Agromyces mariniharenae TaxID=2604423 RepID=A0A5S4UU47_9MICO|nr:response regulator transcription factor [Agromyces mariniharenae]TYL50467.1 response regulator transcription factor [Agromyces mariniharenae]
MPDQGSARGIRVLLVDDQPLIRLGFRMVLEGEPDLTVVGEADDGAAAIARTGELAPDVVVMDVRMPGMDGIAATERIVATSPGARVLIVTTFDLDEYAFAGLRAGASGFLLKNAPPAELVHAIRTVAAGDAIVEPRVTRRLLDLFGGQLPADGAVAPASAEPAPARDPLDDPRLASLTEREAEVFTAIARGMSNAEISSALYLSESTVKTHVGRILMKLGLRDRIHAVVLGYETGVVRPGAPEGRPPA